VSLIPLLLWLFVALCLGTVYEAVINRGFVRLRLTAKERAEARAVQREQSGSRGIIRICTVQEASMANVIGFCVDCDRTRRFDRFGKCSVCGSSATLFRGANRGGLDKRVQPVVQSTVERVERCASPSRKPGRQHRS
jgi:hypothetical protein